MIFYGEVLKLKINGKLVLGGSSFYSGRAAFKSGVVAGGRVHLLWLNLQTTISLITKSVLTEAIGSNL